jgi:LysM repeat protein
VKLPLSIRIGTKCGAFATALAIAPAQTPVPTAAPTPSSCITLGAYIVVVGDTLWDIAQRHGVTVASLLAANPQITDPRLIRVGEEIAVSPLDRRGRASIVRLLGASSNQHPARPRDPHASSGQRVAAAPDLTSLAAASHKLE